MRFFKSSWIVLYSALLYLLSAVVLFGSSQYKEVVYTDTSDLYVVEGKVLNISGVSAFCYTYSGSGPNDCGITTSERVSLSAQTGTAYGLVTFGSSGDFTSANNDVSVGAAPTTASWAIQSNNRSGNQGNRIGKATLINSFSWTPVERTFYVIENSAFNVGVSVISNPVEGGTGTFRFYRTSMPGSADLPTPLTYTISGSASGSEYSGLSGSVTIPSGSLSQDVTVTANNDSVIEGNQTIIVTLNNDGFGFDSGHSSATMTLYDDTPYVSVSLLNGASVEGDGQIGFRVARSIAYAGDTARTVNLSIGGTATNGSDYTPTLSTSITIASGQLYATNWITPVTDSLVEGVETVTMTVLSGNYYLVDSANSTVTAYIYDDYPQVNIQATDGYAAEYATNTGTFTITRSGNTNLSLTVNLTISGTAVAGSNYVALPTNVTFAAGVLITNLTVTPIVTAAVDPWRTVVVSLQTNTSYTLGLYTNAVVTLVGDGPYPRASYPFVQWYFRGSGTNSTNYTIVFPIDGIKGTRRLEMETNSEATLYHLNPTNSGSQSQITNRIAFNTPLVSFGSQWGTTLYIGKPYSLGWFAGDPYQGYPPLQITAYYRSNGAVAGTLSLALPAITNANDWTGFATNGFVRYTEGYGLKSVLRAAPDLDFVTGGRWTYVCTHTATNDAATNYTYRILSKGWADGQPLVIDSQAQSAYDPLYTLEFSVRPTGRSLFLDQPQFAGQPLPPDLLNKTPEEIYNYGAVVTNAITNATSLYTTNDLSPELRRHPTLDQLVSDLNNDPLALANYVWNEIELTDALGYKDDGSVATEAIYEGGVNRSALGVYLEGQGSPVEQCALLIYLLRKAGYPACYVFAAEGGLKLLDSRVSNLLRVKVSGAQDTWGQLYTTNHLLSVNYPWVAAYINGSWVHIFPWLKDTTVTEGVAIYDVLPDPYKTSQLWLKDYVMAKSNIMAFAKPDDDTAGTIFKRYLSNVLATNTPPMSINDIGMKYVNRRHLFADWIEFPRPTWVTNICTPVESLSASTVTNVSPRLTNIFDSVAVELFSVNNPQKKIQTGELRMSDLHNRKFFIAHTNVTDGQYRASLILEPFRSDATGQGSFLASDTGLTNRQATSVTFDVTDDDLTLRFRYRRQRALTWDTAINPNFLELGAAREVLDERALRKGDLAAICINAGRVTPAMVRVHAQELWNMEQTATNSTTANQVSIDVYEGTLTYLMGMNYYQREGEFDALNNALHKLQNLSRFAVGLAKIGPRRDTNELVVAGAIDPVWPNVDMYFQQTASVANGTVRPDSGWDEDLATSDYLALAAADGSSREHWILNSYFGRSNAVSTVKLLQLAQSGTNGIVELTWTNYLTKGDTFYGAKKLKDWNPSLWANVASYFQSGTEGMYAIAWMTPGSVTAPGGYFTDMAALVLTPRQFLAAIGANLRGGFSANLPDNTVNTTTIPNWELREGVEGDPHMNFTQPTSGQKGNAAETTLTIDAQSDVDLINGNAVTFNSTQTQQNQQTELLVRSTLGTSANAVLDGYDISSDGLPNIRYGNGQSGIVADPVNTLTGEFYIDEVDLSLPGPMPLRLRRNYGSQNLAANQLGYGWKLSYMPSLVVALSNNIIYSAEIDGSVLAFASVGTNLWAPTTSQNPTLNNDSQGGIGSIANRMNSRLFKTTVSGTNTYYLTNSDGSLRVFVEKTFALSAAIDRLRPYLATWYDCVGNYYNFEYGTNSTQADYGQVRRIVSSSGNVLRLQYDPYGRIVDAYSLDGRHVQYDYDEHGDLVMVTRPDTSVVLYEYQLLNTVTNSVTNYYSTHLVTLEDKPDGRALQNQYDDQRRVTNQLATVGADLELVRNATFRYTNNFNLTNLTTTLTGTTTVLDWTNNVYSYAYTNGLIRKIVDPLGAQTIQTWYEESETNAPAFPRSLKSVTDKRGLVTSYLYDDRGNATNTTITGDLRGDGDTNATAAAIAVYTNNNLKIKSVDASGTITLFFYTNSWLLSRVEISPTNAVGAQIITNLYSYYSITNSTNNTVSFGLRQQEIRAAYSVDAATNQWSYDARGLVTQQTRYTGNADPSVTSTQVFNNRGELVQQIDAAGRTTRLAYDANGMPQLKEVYEVGQSIPLAWEYSYYNDNGELTWYDGPRFNPEDYVYRDYDGAGRKIFELRWRTRAKQDGTGVEAETGDNLVAATFYQYDPFGDLTKVTDPLGRYTIKKYDALGQLLREEFYDSTGTLLATNGMAYSLAGDVTTIFNPLGGRTDKQYTSTGKLKYQSNPDGSTNGWRYLEDGRIRREIQSNGAYWQTTYDDANRRVTRVFYSAAGTALATNVTDLDRRGNTIQTTDAEGYVSTNLFDGLDRIKVAAGPAIVTVTPSFVPGCPCTNIVQQVTKYVYDASGQTLISSNAFGEKITTTSDALGRTTLVEIRDAGNTVVRSTQTIYATNHHGKIVIAGTGSSAITNVYFTDNQEHPILSVQYPASGVLQYVWQRYDLVGNPAERREYSSTNGQAVIWATNLQTFDGLNRAQTRIEGDGATTTFGYDAAGHIISQGLPGGLTYTATYNSAGQKTLEYDTGSGGISSHTNTYSYWTSSSSFAGRLQYKTDGRSVGCTYTYDDWLHPATNTYVGTTNSESGTRSITYNARGLPTQLSWSFASTNDGPTTTVLRLYDPYGYIGSETVKIGGVQVSSAGQNRGSDGRRGVLGFVGGNNYANAVYDYEFYWRADGLLTELLASSGDSGYGYDTAGILTNRAIESRTTTITSRDGTGRPLAINTALFGSTYINETLTWRGDGVLVRDTMDRADFYDDRAYSYADGSRRLTQEALNLDGSTRWTNMFTYDGGQTAGPGVLTRIGQPQTNGIAWQGAANPVLEISSSTNSVTRKNASGHINGPATMAVWLDYRPVPVTVVSTGNTNWSKQWRATLEVSQGAHQIQARALHPSGQFLATTTNWFTNNYANEVFADQYDAAGFLKTRIRKGNGQTNSTQTLYWDGRGRLWKVVERDATQSGFDWVALYDALDRRLRTTETPVTNGTVLTAQSKVIEQYYDPEFEFLELGAAEDGHVTWKIPGPDLNGHYGGLNGIGGLEAYCPAPELFCPILSDSQGNLVSVYDQTHNSLTWYRSRVTAYGAVPGYRPVPFGDGASLDQARVFGNRGSDRTGFVWMGGNYYDPVSCQFIGLDPRWHEASSSGRSFCNGDPVNHKDPDGRMAARNTEVGRQNAPTPYEWGIAPVMQKSIYTDTYFTDGSHTGPVAPGDAQLLSQDNISGYQYWRVSKPTDDYFFYIRDSRGGGPLADPNYGTETRTPIHAYEFEQQARLDAIKATLIGLLTLDGGAPLLERAGLRMFAAEGATPLQTMLERVGTLDFSTPANKAIFYSGPGQGARAAAFAERTRGMTIDMTAGGRAMTADPLFQSLSPAEQFQVWQRASTPFAEGASGGINAFIRGARPDRTFRTIEEPILNANPNVYRSTYHY